MRKFIIFWIAFLGQFLLMAYAMAEETSHASSGGSLVALGAGLCMGIAALGGTLGQGRAVASALEGVARNPGAAPKVQTPMILGLALIESLVLFSFVIAIMLVGKV